MLIVACSETKTPGAQRAADKYVSRQHSAVAANWGSVGYYAILSAEFGLVPAQRKLPDYNTKMTPAIAKTHHKQIKALLAAMPDDVIYVYGGKVYRDAVIAAAPKGAKVVELVGRNRGCGDHFSALQEFLG